ncbi:MAG: hypothetical protein ACHQY2_06130, partial [Candidatus Eremiobacterales bacterium]
MPTLSIVGLGPSDAALLTLGSLERLERARRVVVCSTPPALVEHLKSRGVKIEPAPFDAAALLRGVDERMTRH